MEQPFKISITEWGRTYCTHVDHSGQSIGDVVDMFSNLLIAQGYGTELIIETLKDQITILNQKK
jgi:hypothetical protein